MSKRIYDLIRQNGFAGSQQVEQIAQNIASASKEEVNFKVSPKLHLYFLLYLTLSCLQAFIFLFHSPWFRLGVVGLAFTWLQGMGILP